jgi:hypothetical protein
MKMKKTLFLSSCALALSVASGASAQQDVLPFQVCTSPLSNNFCAQIGTSYAGVAWDSAIIGTSSISGGVGDADGSVVNDAYDGWGALYGTTNASNPYAAGAAYATAFNGLTGLRQTESFQANAALPNNSVRWVDSFTNTTGATITANIAFSGNLGSDNNTRIITRRDGFIVTAQAPNGAGISTDPVILHLYGNNAYTTNSVVVNAVDGDDNPSFVYPITVAPGQTVSIMVFNVLFGDQARGVDANSFAADVALANAFGEVFINSPVFDGMTADQIASLVNWNVLIDGRLPGAGTLAPLTFGAQEALGNLIARASILGTTPDAAPGGVTVSSSGTGRAPLLETAKFFVVGAGQGGEQAFAAGSLEYNGAIVGLGAETEISPDMNLGVILGRSNASGSMAGAYGSMSAEGTFLSTYATFNLQGFKAFAAAQFSANDYGYSRVAGAATAVAAFGGKSVGLDFGLSRDLTGDETGLAVFGGASYARASFDAYTETGAGAANLSVASYAISKTDLHAGLRNVVQLNDASAPQLLGYVGGGLGHGSFGDGTAATRYATSATVNSTAIDAGASTYGFIEAGISGTISDGVTVDASYEGRFGNDTVSNAAAIKLKVQF